MRGIAPGLPLRGVAGLNCQLWNWLVVCMNSSRAVIKHGIYCIERQGEWTSSGDASHFNDPRLLPTYWQPPYWSDATANCIPLLCFLWNRIRKPGNIYTWWRVQLTTHNSRGQCSTESSEYLWACSCKPQYTPVPRLTQTQGFKKYKALKYPELLYYKLNLFLIQQGMAYGNYRLSCLNFSHSHTPTRLQEYHSKSYAKTSSLHSRNLRTEDN
jgi:hypothetical protein